MVPGLPRPGTPRRPGGATPGTIPVAEASGNGCIASGEFAPGRVQVAAAVEVTGGAGALGSIGAVEVAGGVLGSGATGDIGPFDGVAGATGVGAGGGGEVVTAPGRGDSGAEPSPRSGSPRPRGASTAGTPADRTIASI